ncbi:hypothetical protein EGI16_13210 [Chryseobacterium sp. G0240]|nr:hypothetical protein EGI16_13210 [Chryseobacterium sp. G0240]
MKESRLSEIANHHIQNEFMFWLKPFSFIQYKAGLKLGPIEYQHASIICVLIYYNDSIISIEV